MSNDDKTNMKMKGEDVWVNQKTGEVRETINAEIQNPPRRNEPFVISILPYIIRMTDIVGNKKLKVVNYILENMSFNGKYANTLIITQKELADEANVSIQTVSITLKALEKANIIEKKTGAIMLHPKLVMKGDANKEKALMVKFKKFNSDIAEGQTTIEDHQKEE